MLPWFYDTFGLVGSLLIFLFFFTMFVFWISGFAGILHSRNSDRKKNIMIGISIFFPPFPIIWLISDIWRQHKVIKGKA